MTPADLADRIDLTGLHGDPIIAVRPATCFECREPISPGDLVVWIGRNTYCCAACALMIADARREP